ncbi:DinB family protein [Aestuariibius sp. 2305UL40-4]|uniref:DinB family protein n=1 Tax=Aestuariibius violaceus TaxID=3234132 RepID=UPI00345E129E
MIGAEYCRTMAAYNAWQNKSLIDALEDLPPGELGRDRGAFFGSIFATINHLLWADGVWVARFDGGERPSGSIADSPRLTEHLSDWRPAREAMDQRITGWAAKLSDHDLEGDLTWYSGSVGREITRTKALCVVQLFNHQTHHRGQIHAMLTAAGAEGYVTDVPFTPDGD